MRRAKRTTSVADVVQLLARRSWEDIDNDDRLIMELACVTIQKLEQRTIRLAQALERIEAGR